MKLAATSPVSTPMSNNGPVLSMAISPQLNPSNPTGLGPVQIHNPDIKGLEFETFGKDTVLFLGVWEQINNPGFNSLEFEGIRNEAGRNSFFLSARNLESLNAVLIRQGLPAPARLLKLNEIAITQMRTLLAEPNLKRLKG